jgi:selenocysteine-specific elongation factor
MNIIVGTAGHIDHGKTSLVLALTGVDADRLPEEKQRGITIDLGFAELSGGDSRIGFVDVPGHERFVKNMLAGVSGIDAVALVVAADEGVMPQTREHFDICRLLGVEHGLVILTKTDMVDDEFIELVEMDVAGLVEGSFLENAPVFPVSSKTGHGVDEVKKALFDLIPQIKSRTKESSTRLPVDRKFSVKGFGSVVTGTLAAGEITVGDDMELLPLGRKVRVRGVQTHGSDVKRARAGQRTAVNLGGVDNEEVERGLVLAELEAFRETQIVDCRIEVLKDAAKPIRSRQRVRVHFGTVEALARIEVLNELKTISPGDSGFVQVRFEQPVTGVPAERFILRQYSPQITIAGGTILDAHARKRRRTELAATRKRLKELGNPEIEQARRTTLMLEPFAAAGCDLKTLRALTGLKAPPLKSSLTQAKKAGAIVEADGVFVAQTAFEELVGLIVERIQRFHVAEPLKPGIARETLREQTAAHAPVDVFRAALEKLTGEKKIRVVRDIVASSSHIGALTDAEREVKEGLLKAFSSAGLQVPSLKDAIENSSRVSPPGNLSTDI